MTCEDCLLPSISFESQTGDDDDTCVSVSPLCLTNMVLMSADSLSGLSISCFMARFIPADAGTGVNWFPHGDLMSIHQKQTSGQHSWLCLPGQFSNWLIFEGHFPILDKWFHKYVPTSGFSPGHSERFKISE